MDKVTEVRGDKIRRWLPGARLGGRRNTRKDKPAQAAGALRAGNVSFKPVSDTHHFLGA